MAIMSTMQVVLLLWCSYGVGLSSARTLQQQQPATELAEDDVDITQELTPYDVRCDVAGCEYDLQLYCLSNGVIVMGSCSLKKTLCTNGKRNSKELANDWNSCFLATYTIVYPHQAAAAGRPQSIPLQEPEEGQGPTEGGQQGREDKELLNMRLEQQLLTDLEKNPDPEVKVMGKVGDEGGEVQANDGSDGDSA